MLFSRKYKVRSNSRLTDVKHRLLGKHTTVHSFDFEIYEDEDLLHIVPNREHRDDDGSILPVMHLKLNEANQQTDIQVVAEMRAQDAGGPYLVLVFTLLLLLGSAAFYLIDAKEFEIFYLTTLGLGVLIFSIFWIKMEMGYFSHVRKLKQYLQAVLN